MAHFRRICCLVLGMACLVWTGQTPAQEPAPARTKPPEVKKKPEPSKFLRVKRDAKEAPIALETATVRYSGEPGGVAVDLIGVVHIGEKTYYEALNRKMEEYDVVLYELVAPEGTRIPKGAKRNSDNPISMLQGLMKGVLDLESQMEHIDYTKKHFVHADLSPDKMAEAMRERGDDPLTLALSVAADFMRKANVEAQRQEKAKAAGKPLAIEEDLDLMSLFLDPNASVKLKRMMAEQFESQGDLGLGTTLNTILITDRNKACMKVLGKEIAKGKKKIAIFYGAAHMPDFEDRLRDEYGLKRDKDEWLTAWDLKPKRGLQIPPLLKILGGDQ